MTPEKHELPRISYTFLKFNIISSCKITPPGNKRNLKLPERRGPILAADPETNSPRARCAQHAHSTHRGSPLDEESTVQIFVTFGLANAPTDLGRWDQDGWLRLIHYLGVRKHPRSQPLNQIWTADIDRDYVVVGRKQQPRHLFRTQ